MKNSELERLIKSAFGSPGFSTQATNADWEKMESLLSDPKPVKPFGWLPYGAIAASVATIGVAIMMYFNDADIPQYAYLSRITPSIETADLLPSSNIPSQSEYVIRELAKTVSTASISKRNGANKTNVLGKARRVASNQSTVTSVNPGATDSQSTLTDSQNNEYFAESLSAKRPLFATNDIKSLVSKKIEAFHLAEEFSAKQLETKLEKEGSLMHLELSLLGGVEFTTEIEQQPLVNRSINSDLSLSSASTPIFGGQVSLIKKNFALTTGLTFGTLKQNAQLSYSTEQASIETYTTTRVETNIDSTLIDHFLKPYHNPETGRLELTYEETYAYDTTSIEHVEEHQKEVLDTLQHAWSGQVVVSSFRIPLSVGYRKPLGKWILLANGGVQLSVNKVTVVSDEPYGELASVLNVVQQEVRSSITPSMSFMASVGAGYQIAPQWRIDVAAKSSIWQAANQTNVLPSAQFGLTYSLY